MNPILLECPVPARLFYNCSDPRPIIETRLVKPSKVHTGVSMSAFSELGSHGPFKIEFKTAPWFAHFKKVWRPKGHMFENEDEWYCPNAVAFDIADVVLVTYMVNAPRIYPIITKRVRKHFATNMPDRYMERSVADPYLENFA